MNLILNYLVPIEDMSKAETIYTRVNISDLNEKYATFIKWDVFINSLFKEYNSTNFVNESRLSYSAEHVHVFLYHMISYDQI